MFVRSQMVKHVLDVCRVERDRFGVLFVDGEALTVQEGADAFFRPGQFLHHRAAGLRFVVRHPLPAGGYREVRPALCLRPEERRPGGRDRRDCGLPELALDPREGAFPGRDRDRRRGIQHQCPRRYNDAAARDECISAARGLLLIDDSAQGLAILSGVLKDSELHWTYHLAALHALAEAGPRAAPIKNTIADAELDKFSDYVRQQILKNL